MTTRTWVHNSWSQVHQGIDGCGFGIPGCFFSCCVAWAIAWGGRELKGTESICWKAFADAMEVVPTTLAENAGLNPIRVVTDLRHRHVLGERNAAVSIRRRLGPGSAHAPAPARSIIAVDEPGQIGVQEDQETPSLPMTKNGAYPLHTMSATNIGRVELGPEEFASQVAGAINIWLSRQDGTMENMSGRDQHPGWGNMARGFEKGTEDSRRKQWDVGYGYSWA